MLFKTSHLWDFAMAAPSTLIQHVMDRLIKKESYFRRNGCPVERIREKREKLVKLFEKLLWRLHGEYKECRFREMSGIDMRC